MRAIRERDGVPIADSTWQELEALAMEHGLAPPTDFMAAS